MRLLTQVAIAIILLDQITKWLVVRVMDLRTLGTIDVLPPVLNFRMAWNRGINFGLFGNDGEVMRWVLVALSLAISAWVIRWIRSEPNRPIVDVSGGILIGGALGNVLDRLIYGAVADFLNMSCCGIENPYVFNVADIAIFFGAVGLVIFMGKPKPGGEVGGGQKKKTP
jgi:signal peptidase II